LCSFIANVVCLLGIQFNMHYLAAYDESARQSYFRALGDGGFDAVLEGLVGQFGLDNLTCFHASYMGVTECDDSFTHTNIYGTGNKAFNMIFPVITVDGTKPELDIISSDNPNVVVSIPYEHDKAIVMRDWVYHKTSAIDYADAGLMRVVIGMYCAQIDATNSEIIAHIYNGEDPAPFYHQFDLPVKEYHCCGEHSLPKSAA